MENDEPLTFRAGDSDNEDDSDSPKSPEDLVREWKGLGIQQRQDRPRSGRRESLLEKPAAIAHENEEARIMPTAATDPSMRVQALLEHGDRHKMFVEMEQLYGSGEYAEWRETHRWVRFEENVEEGGNRWSKPHVATLSLHALFELRSCMMNGAVVLDVRETELADIMEKAIDEMVHKNMINPQYKDKILHTLVLVHKHQHERMHKRMFKVTSQSMVRKISQINLHNMMHPHHHQSQPAMAMDHVKVEDPSLSSPQMNNGGDSLKKKENQSTASLRHSDSNARLEDHKGDLHFLKKLPKNCEACNILIGEVEYLHHPIAAFIRLADATFLGDLTEVPVKTRFIFFLLGPMGGRKQYMEIGRSMGAMMSDEIYHDLAFEAQGCSDLLDGVDEFLDHVTVLPPGEWDPNIRIEPPTSIQSQENRRIAPTQNGISKDAPDGAAGGHGTDPALKRTGKLFGGLVQDIRRKMPHYLSDFKDGLNLQCFATVIFMYFAMLAPIVTFGGLLEVATDKNMAAMENLMAACLCGVVYHTFSGQPLTVLGSTGPALVFEAIIFNMSADLGLWYLSLRFWIGMWIFIILTILVMTDASALVSYISRFTEESFAILISLIYIVQAFKNAFHVREEHDYAIYKVHPDISSCLCERTSSEPFIITDDIHRNFQQEFDYKFAHKHHYNLSTMSWFFNNTVTNYTAVPLDVCHIVGGDVAGTACYRMNESFLASLLLMLGTFFLATALKLFRNSFFFRAKVRQIISDFAVVIAIMVFIGVSQLLNIETPTLTVPSTFAPTSSKRNWLIPPFNGNAWWTVFLAIPPALLACILLFMDQQITAVIVNRKENKLKKGCGYHLDLLVLAILVAVCSVLGLPYYVAATVLSLTHVNALRIESECKAPGDKAAFIGVREQRVTGIVTFILIGVSVFFTKALVYIPMPVLYGVFLYMGYFGMKGLQLVDRFFLLFMPMKYQPDFFFLRYVRIKRVHLFTFFQLLCLILLCVVKEIKVISIVFPFMLIVMVGVRKLLERVFTDEELRYLDDPIPEMHLRRKDDAAKKAKKADKAAGIKKSQSGQNLQFTLASGNVMKIPIDKRLQKKESKIDLSHELEQTGMWRTIDRQQSTGSNLGANTEDTNSETSKKY